MASNEAVAYPILRQHDVDYILVIFGGLLGYSGYVGCLSLVKAPTLTVALILLEMTSTSSCGWSESRKVSGPTRSRNPTTLPTEANTRSMLRRKSIVSRR